MQVTNTKPGQSDVALFLHYLLHAVLQEMANFGAKSSAEEVAAGHDLTGKVAVGMTESVRCGLPRVLSSSLLRVNDQRSM